MHSTSIYGLELLILEGKKGKALATDHRGNTLPFKMNEIATLATCNLQIFLEPPRLAWPLGDRFNLRRLLRNKNNIERGDQLNITLSPTPPTPPLCNR